MPRDGQSQAEELMPNADWQLSSWGVWNVWPAFEAVCRRGGCCIGALDTPL